MAQVLIDLGILNFNLQWTSTTSQESVSLFTLTVILLMILFFFNIYFWGFSKLCYKDIPVKLIESCSNLMSLKYLIFRFPIWYLNEWVFDEEMISQKWEGRVWISIHVLSYHYSIRFYYIFFKIGAQNQCKKVLYWVLSFVSNIYLFFPYSFVYLLTNTYVIFL